MTWGRPYQRARRTPSPPSQIAAPTHQGHDDGVQAQEREHRQPDAAERGTGVGAKQQGGLETGGAALRLEAALLVGGRVGVVVGLGWLDGGGDGELGGVLVVAGLAAWWVLAVEQPAHECSFAGAGREGGEVGRWLVSER
jgi:hypothetical protein